MTTATFDEARAAEKAARAIRDRFAAVRDKAEEETLAALAAAEAYARHLAAGGDPREGFERPRRHDGPKYIAVAGPLEIVYREWAAAAGSRNPFSPIESLRDWEVASYGLARVGEPVTFATYRDEVVSANVNSSLQSDDVARALASCQDDDLVLRRTKVGGKIAYLLRERRDGEDFVGHRHGDGRVSIFATNVPEERWTP